MNQDHEYSTPGIWTFEESHTVYCAFEAFLFIIAYDVFVYRTISWSDLGAT